MPSRSSESPVDPHTITDSVRAADLPELSSESSLNPSMITDSIRATRMCPSCLCESLLILTWLLIQFELRRHARVALGESPFGSNTIINSVRGSRSCPSCLGKSPLHPNTITDSVRATRMWSSCLGESLLTHNRSFHSHRCHHFQNHQAIIGSRSFHRHNHTLHKYYKINYRKLKQILSSCLQELRTNKSRTSSFIKDS